MKHAPKVTPENDAVDSLVVSRAMNLAVAAEERGDTEKANSLLEKAIGYEEKKRLERNKAS